MRKVNLTIILCCLIQIASQAQSPKFVTDSLDVYVREAMDVWQIPGVAVCIVKDGQIVFEKGYGVQRLGQPGVVDEHTVFPIASVTKTFIGTALATLEAEGKIQLDQPLIQTLPSFRMKNKLYEAQISITDVLSHRSGWKTFQGDLLNTESTLSKEAMLQKFGLLEPVYPIRTRFGYSNFGFMLAGEAIEPISGEYWATYLQNRFFKPLSMSRTLSTVEAIQNATNISTPHTLVNGKVKPLLHDEINPQAFGGVYSSAHDLGVWLSVLLEKGIFDKQEIIPASAIEKMWYSRTIIGKQFAADRNRYLKTYGLGWEIIQYQNSEVVQHGGAYSGTLTMVGLIPSLRLGLVVLTNQDGHILQEALKWQIFDAYLGKSAPNYVQASVERRRKQLAELSAKQSVSDIKIPASLLSVPMSALVGTYESEVYGKATIQQKEDSFILQLEHHPKIVATLTSAGATDLTCTYNHSMFGETILPIEIEKGEIIGFTLFVDAFVEADGYQFKKLR